MGKWERHIIKELAREGHTSAIFTDPLNRLVRGTDAGIYRLIPRMVVQVNNEVDVLAALKVTKNAGASVTFKAGGTSLSGQTVTDSILLETGPDYSRYSISSDGNRISLQPGITGGIANAALARYYKKIGPCPASILSAKIGGIIGNNASGANYGIASNSYNTLEGLRIVLADGSLLDSRDPGSRVKFAAEHRAIISGIVELRRKILSNKELIEKVKRKYLLKNTTGYGINSLVDFEDPIDILWHLMIGSEGTLGFVSEATYRTVNSYPKSAAALILLPDIREACKAIKPLLNCRVSAAEMMDRNALLSVRNLPGIPEFIKNPPENAVALLIDTSAANDDELRAQIAEIVAALKDIRMIYPLEFIRDLKEYNRIWKVRKGLFTSAAATRPGGTSCLIEDVAFRPEMLADALVSLRELIRRFNYSGSVMWGHLLDGNVHFVIMPDFRSQTEIDKYSRFMEDLVRLTAHDFDGSLKAEHGTGRNMAPFVREEWGSELYSIMKGIKQLLDPGNLLNPGVLLNDDPQLHLKNLKPIPVADENIDKCIECGFCESDCPSKDLTFTPRHRIVAYREMHRMSSTVDLRTYKRQIEKTFSYNVDDTCATDGLCALACPVEINTGKLVKELRFKKRGFVSRKIADALGNNMQTTTAVMRGLLRALSAVTSLTGERFMKQASLTLHKISGSTIPLWNPYMPYAAKKLRLSGSESINGEYSVVYFPSCINRTFGIAAGYGKREPGAAQKTVELLQKAGYKVIIPGQSENLCCGMAFDSKGFIETGIKKARELEAALMKASDNGKIPVLCDMSPCLLRMKEVLSPDLRLYEPVEFTLQFLVPRLNFKKLDRTVAVHSTCSSVKMGLTDDLVRLAGMCCTKVVVPENVGCCGWAGDRGFSVPELSASALSNLRRTIPADVKEAYSTSRTCEIGLTLHSGITYKSILYLVDEATSGSVRQ